MMVSTLSTMDVSSSYFLGSNFYNYNRNAGKGKAYFISNNITPYDEVYSINVPGNENIQHPFVFQENIIRDIIIHQELMPTDYYLQNRTFTKDRDIECSGSMVVGRDVLPTTNYLYNINNHDLALSTTETKKTQPVGDVVLSSGKTLLLEAKDKIIFKTGFKASSGSHFTAKIDNQNPNLRSATNDFSPCSQIKKQTRTGETIIYKLSNKNTIAQWQLKGYETNFNGSGNEFKIPENLRKGQYSLHASTPSCPLASIVFNVEKQVPKNITPITNTEKIGNSSVKIIPNPSDKQIKVSSNEFIREIEFTDSFGKQLFVKFFDRNIKNMDINVSEYASGIYLIKVKLENGNYETKRVVVQH
jgi:hypothetical protein